MGSPGYISNASLIRGAGEPQHLDGSGPGTGCPREPLAGSRWIPIVVARGTIVVGPRGGVAGCRGVVVLGDLDDAPAAGDAAPRAPDDGAPGHNDDREV